MSTYMQINGIQGDVTAKGHENWIQLEGFHFNVSRSISTDPGRIADRESTRPAISEVIINKKADKTFPLLFNEACVGKAKPQVVLHVCQTDDSLKPYMEITLNNAIVSHYSIKQDPSTVVGKPEEVIGLSFDKIEVRYTPYDNTNQAQSPVSGAYDLKQAVSA